jgi:hypothetical protein
MIRFGEGSQRLLIACHSSDELAPAAQKFAAKVIAADSGFSYSWHTRDGRTIGRFDQQSLAPIFVQGPEGQDLTDLEERFQCIRGAGIFLCGWKEGGIFSAAKPRRYFRAGLLREPIVGMKKALIISSDERYDAAKGTLMKAVTDAFIGAAVNPNYAGKVLFSQDLRQRIASRPGSAGEERFSVI